jgi:hypothetical protein
MATVVTVATSISIDTYKPNIYKVLSGFIRKSKRQKCSQYFYKVVTDGYKNERMRSI